MANHNDDYKPGNPEYDFWNDKNLYPSLRHEYDDAYPPHQPDSSFSNSDGKVGFGTLFSVIFMWILIFAPFALFLDWGNWLLQTIFWGGIAIILLVFILCLYNIYQDEKQRKQ